MEYNTFDTDQKSSFDSFELQVTTEAQGYLKTTANWATFLSILGFIMLGLGVLGSFAIIIGGAAAPSTAIPFNLTIIGVISLIFNILGGIPVVFLFKFASKIKAAISEMNTQAMTNAFKSLKSHYVFVGIYIILAIVAYIIFVVYFMSMAAAMGGIR